MIKYISYPLMDPFSGNRKTYHILCEIAHEIITDRMSFQMSKFTVNGYLNLSLFLFGELNSKKIVTRYIY